MKSTKYIYSAVITAAFVISLAVFASGWRGANAQNVAGAAPPASIPTISAVDIARQGGFYVGGHYVGAPGKETMDGAMYVEVLVPKNIRHPYPIVFLCGGAGRSGLDMLQTADGRPGWAYDFLREGYTVYTVDFPGRGRSAFVPDVDGKLTIRTAPLMEEVWSASAEMGQWPQAKKFTQWPSNAPNKGKMGDPVFDAFAKAQLATLTGLSWEKTTVDDIVQLLDLIGQPVTLIIHSAAGASGWLVADARPKLVKGIIAVEPVAPPIQNAERGSTGPGRLWGLTNLPIHYDPPINGPSELQPVRLEKPDGPDLVACWVQKEPAHKLVNLKGIPVLNVSGEASYHRPYAYCVAKWLNQAGVKTTYVNLEDVGLRGNNHMMMLEKNSAGIAKYFQSWIEKNVH
jgi:pimeloyl-ACP methyl ester carboxylesterase